MPGVIVTQHSGSGKANQYFLRGFNLDHGTDLAISVDGVPINMPTHAHGQGYADLNFVIPELVERIDYRKGPYYANIGDFGSAGAIGLHLSDRLATGIATLEGGQFGHVRGVLADSANLGPGDLTGAVELEHDDGPWVQGDDARKVSALLRYATGDSRAGWSLTAMGYHNRWRATDQIPRRAIVGVVDPVAAPAAPAADLVSRFGTVDPSDGGRSGRYLLSGAWHHAGTGTETQLMAYALRYDLTLFSNFTYFLEDPVNGDQLEQRDRRWVTGGALRQTWRPTLLGLPNEVVVGVDARHDAMQVDLLHTRARHPLETRSAASVRESLVSPYLEVRTRWASWLRSVAGVRLDAKWLDVRDRTDADLGGSAARHVASPKLNVVFGPVAKTEIYVNYGQGFHSNDARGVVAKIDPATALPKSSGEEIGLRTTAIPHLRSELSLWRLHLRSELVWDGDAGTNEASGPTTRYGIEVSNWYTPTRWLTIDADYAWSHARFTDQDPVGSFVPEALVGTFDGGVALHDLGRSLERWSAGLRVRYFGARPLTRDGSVRSAATTLLYADVGYRLSPRVSIRLTVFNLLDAKTSDIEYFYTSRLRGEPLAGVDDLHTHPSEPRAVRLQLAATF